MSELAFVNEAVAAPPRRVCRRALLLGVPLALGVPAGLAVRHHFFSPKFAVRSIREGREFQDAELLARAWALPVARSYRGGFEYQHNGSTCGPSSLTNVLRSRGVAADERSVMEGTGLCSTGVCMGGLTLDEFATVAARRGRTTLLRDLGYDAFLARLRDANNPRTRYIVNFLRGPLFGQGGGHHSPIGGYLEKENLVFVLDTNARFQPFLVSPERLYEAMNTVDGTNGKKRGLLRIE
jgi:Phytochelatin synthase